MIQSTASPAPARIQILPPSTCGDKLLFRVFDQAAPIGFARLSKRKNRRQGRPDNVIDMFDPEGFNAYELKMIEVAQNYRHRGVGTTLLQAVINYCRDCNINRVTGEIKGDARTLRRWYERNGFQVSGDDRIELSPTLRV